MTSGNRDRVDRTLDQVDKRDLVRMGWTASIPMEEIMIIEFQTSIICNNAWLKTCLHVPTKGTLENYNKDLHPNMFWNTVLIASLPLFSPCSNPSYLDLQKPPHRVKQQGNIMGEINQSTISDENPKFPILLFCDAIWQSILIMPRFFWLFPNKTIMHRDRPLLTPHHHFQE